MSLTKHLGVITKIADHATHDFMEVKDVATITLEKWESEGYPLEFKKIGGTRNFNIPIQSSAQPTYELFKELFDINWALGSQILTVFPEAKEVIRGRYFKDTSYVDLRPDQQYRPDDIRISPAVGDLMEINIDYHIGQVKIYKIASDNRTPVNLWDLDVVDEEDLDEYELAEQPDLLKLMMESLQPMSPKEFEVAGKIKAMLEISKDSDIHALVEEHGEEAVAKGVESFLIKMENPEERWEYQQKMLTYPFKLIHDVVNKVRS